jgi:SNF2 family DNA or RNA helicase
VGIELTSASVVIHYDRWWNPAREDQATDRVHRIGQSKNVQVFKLVTKHTIEERIHALIMKKKELLNEVVGFDDQMVIKQFSHQDIVDLLQEVEKDCGM